MDIKKYFESIDKEILFNILERKITSKKLLKVIRTILDSKNDKKGLPIGNYTSQTFANIYLNELDQYVKRNLKCKYYYRYMDDSIILLKSKQEAIDVLEKIKTFLNEKLKLELNSKTQIFKNRQGVNFCGYKINEYRLKIRERNKKSLKKKLKVIYRKIKKERLNYKEAFTYLAGHKGYLSIANVNNLSSKYFRLIYLRV